MIKIPLNYHLNMAFAESIFFGEALFNGKLLNIGDLHLLKDNYGHLWVHISKISNEKGNRLVVELEDPPSWLGRRNEIITQSLKRTIPSRFFCAITYEDDFSTCKLLNVSTMLQQNEIDDILKKMVLRDFAESVLSIYLEKKVISE